jgi:hypothetical protein
MGGVVCFTPLTVYLFWLAAVNRRDRPTVVAGTWDFVALLAGLSGFLGCGTGLFLSVVVAGAHLWGGNTFEEIRDSWGKDRTAWTIALAALLAAVGLAVGLTLVARRRVLVAYNTDLPAADAALSRVFDDLGLPVKRLGHLWTDGRRLVEVVPFHLFRHVSFRLVADDPRLREELDRRLRAAVPDQPAGDNPVAPWITTTAASLFITVLCCVLLIGTAVFAVR